MNPTHSTNSKEQGGNGLPVTITAILRPLPRDSSIHCSMPAVYKPDLVCLTWQQDPGMLRRRLCVAVVRLWELTLQRLRWQWRGSNILPSLSKPGVPKKLPFPDAIFDAVVMNFGLLHIAQPELALAEAYRVLRSGGRVAFTVWGDPNTCLGFKIILNAIAAHGAMDVPLPEGPPFFRFSDVAESKRVMTEAGFKGPTVEEIHVDWEMQDADVLFETFLYGAVRTGALLQAQKPEALAAIRMAVQEAAMAFDEAGSIRLPMAAVLSYGRKP